MKKAKQRRRQRYSVFYASMVRRGTSMDALAKERLLRKMLDAAWHGGSCSSIRSS